MAACPATTSEQCGGGRDMAVLMSMKPGRHGAAPAMRRARWSQAGSTPARRNDPRMVCYAIEAGNYEVVE